MNTKNGGQVLLAEFVAAVAMLTWREIKAGHVPPRPQVYTSAGLAFALLGLLSDMVSPELASIIGGGLVFSLTIYGGILPKTSGSPQTSTTPTPGQVKTA